MLSAADLAMRLKTSSLILCLLPWGQGFAAEGLARPSHMSFERPSPAPPGDSPAEVLADHGDLLVTSLSERDRLFAERVLLPRRRRGIGGAGRGADLADLAAVQTRFLDSRCGLEGCREPCNAVMLAWTENQPNPDGIDVLIDGELAESVPGLPANQLPGANGVLLSGARISAGWHTFQVQELNLGASARAKFLVLDSQPFADVENVSCERGAAEEDGSCALVSTWTNPGAPADSRVILVDGVPAGELVDGLPEAVVEGIESGQRCIEVAGLLENEDGSYRGCFVESCCRLDCAPLPCSPPVGLGVCQSAYGPGEDSQVVVTWVNGESAYGALRFFVDDQFTASAPGFANTAVFRNIAPGEYRLGILGDCGGAGVSTIREKTFTVRASSPHVNPIRGGIRCELDSETGITTVTWTIADPSAFGVIWVKREPHDPDSRPLLSAILGGRSARAEIPDTSEDMLVQIQFFTFVDGLCYGSERTECIPSPGRRRFFIRGNCDGAGTFPTITSAVFGLRYLFQGGAPPPCREACDTDGDHNLNITDMIVSLRFLFSSGAPPFNWIDADGDGEFEPTCEPVLDGHDCRESHSGCGV